MSDRELDPAVWLLTRPLVAHMAAPYVNLDAPDREGVVDWGRLLKESRMWSSGERIYVQVAFHLWSSHTLPVEFQSYRWGTTLSANNRRPLIEALMLSLGLAEAITPPGGATPRAMTVEQLLESAG